LSRETRLSGGVRDPVRDHTVQNKMPQHVMDVMELLSVEKG
jgi:hypothetical protein